MQMIEQAGTAVVEKISHNKTPITRRQILTSDTAMAQFLLSVAQEARESNDTGLAEHFVEVAFDILDQTA